MSVGTELRDPWGWLFPLPSLFGLGGVIRMRNLGQDDLWAWLLIPVFGVMLTIALLSAIVIGLTPDEKWSARFRPGEPVQRNGWLAVIAMVISLLLGGAALMGTMAFGGQKFFEYQALREAGGGSAPTGSPTR